MNGYVHELAASGGSEVLIWICIFLTGAVAGVMNAVVGSGTLVTFPVLLLFGYPPLVANLSNTLGLVAGNVSSSIGYRHQAWEQSAALRRLIPASISGGVIGALLLFVLPGGLFRLAVPVLLAIGVVMVFVGPVVQRQAAVQSRTDASARRRHAVTSIALLGFVGVVGVYGGYFGASQGVLLTGLLGVLSAMSMQSILAVRTILVTAVNAVSSIIYLIVAPGAIDWSVVLLIMFGSAVGGTLGVRIGRRLSPTLLRVLIAILGVVAIAALVN